MLNIWKNRKKIFLTKLMVLLMKFWPSKNHQHARYQHHQKAALSWRLLLRRGFRLFKTLFSNQIDDVANQKPLSATVSRSGQKTKAAPEKARHASEIDSPDTCWRSSQTWASKNAFRTLLFVRWWKSYFGQRRSYNKMLVKFQQIVDSGDQMTKTVTNIW